MPWFKVDDSFYDHPKIFDAPDCAVALWTRAGSWSARNLTDGFVPTRITARFCDDPDTAVKELMARGLWLPTGGGWQMLHAVPGIPGGREIELWTLGRDDYRQRIPAAVKDLVYERDEYRCVECGAVEDLTLDHIFPWSCGGRDTVGNLQVLCRPCNSSKGARLS